MPHARTKTDIITLLKELIGFPTISADRATNQATLDWYKYQLRGLPLHLRDFEHNGTPSLIITTQDTQTPKLWLAAHIDVVPGSPNVFLPEARGDRLYGRGSFDMKFAAAVFLQLALDLGSSLPQYDFGIMLTTDEEIGGTNGVKALMEAGYRSRAVILPDAATNWQIEQQAKGISHWDFHATGLAVHGGRPWLGENAVDRLIAFLGDLRSQFPAEPCDTHNHAHNNMSLGALHGGLVANQVPDNASAKVDIRFVPEMALEGIYQLVHTTLARHPQVTGHETQSGDANFVDIENHFVRRFARHIKRVTGEAPEYITSHAASDARFISPYRIPVILSRPPGDGQHGEEEWVSISGVHLYHRLLRGYVDEVARLS